MVSIPSIKFLTPKCSLGECIASVSKPNPMSTVSRPSSFLNKATMGILPPSRMGIGVLPNTSTKALLAAWYDEELVDVTAGSPPCSGVTLTFT